MKFPEATASERHRPWPVPIYTAWCTDTRVQATCLRRSMTAN